MKIEREHLLKILTVASLGLNKRETTAQSTFYVFDGEHLVTFNDEILTRCANPLEDVGKAAVPAEELHQMLAKFPDPEVTITLKKGQLRIKGKKREAAINVQKKIERPYKDVPLPKKWREAPEKLSAVLLQAARCAGKDETRPMMMAVHMNEDRIEATDSYRLFRCDLETGFPRSVLIPAASLERVGGLVVEEVGYTKKGKETTWLHLKMPEEHHVSIRCMSGEFPNLIPMMKMKDPHKVKLPANLDDIIARADIMQESTSDALVHVSIAEGKLKLKAEKETGWYREEKRIDYDGEPLVFSVHPKFLEEVFSKKKTVLVAGKRMKLKVDEYTFVICLNIGDGKPKKEDPGEEE